MIAQCDWNCIQYNAISGPSSMYMLGSSRNDVVLVRMLTVIRTSVCCRPVTLPVTRLAMVSYNSDVTNTTVTNGTVAKSTTVTHSTVANNSSANSTASKNTTLSAVYGFQVSICQFNFPNRVLWKGEALLFAEALTIRFVFPRAYDVDIHLFSFLIYFEQL